MIRRPPRSTLFPTRRSSDLLRRTQTASRTQRQFRRVLIIIPTAIPQVRARCGRSSAAPKPPGALPPRGIDIVSARAGLLPPAGWDKTEPAPYQTFLDAVASHQNQQAIENVEVIEKSA